MSMLLSPAHIANLDLKNRVVMSPMCLFGVERQDGVVSALHRTHYGARAIGQVGLICVEATAVQPNGRITDNDLGLWNDQQAQAFAQMMDELHELGSKVGVQLAHAGRKAEDALDLVAPSPIAFNDTSRTPHELSIEEIGQVRQAFVEAAKRAQAAGVDMIEIHAAHGYLLDEFLSPKVNQRTDEYGGSLENRYRLLHEVALGMREVFDGSLWTRLSLTDYQPSGQQNTIEEWQKVGTWLERDGVDCLDISTGGLFDVTPNIPVHPGYQTPYAAAMKQAVNIPVATVGLMTEPGLCEYVLQNEQADLIMEGRVLLRDANWLAKAAVELHDHDFKAFSESYWRGEPAEWQPCFGYERTGHRS